MTAPAEKRAVLGIDPTSRGLAFVYFEGGRLLDWGTRRVPGNDLAAFERILALCPTDVLVTEDASAPGCERRPRARAVLQILERAARSRGLEVQKVSRLAVRAAWSMKGAGNKRAVASAIAALFPVLETILPRWRVGYASSAVARVEIFDAASLVLHHWGVPDGITRALLQPQESVVSPSEDPERRPRDAG